MQQFRQLVRGLPRAYWYLWLGTLVNRLGNFVVPFLALYLTRIRHFPLAQTGLIVSMYGAGSLAAGPLGGICADYFGRRGTMLASMVCASITMLVLGTVDAPLPMALAVLSLGFVGDLGRPAVYATVADLLPPSARPQAYGLLSWAINLGFAISPIVAGAVSSQGFAYLFIADAITTLGCAFIIWRCVPESRPTRAASATNHPIWHYLAPYRDRIYAPFIGLTFATTLLFYQSNMALPLDMGRHGIPPSTYGYLIALNGALIVLLQPIALTFMHRWSRPHVLSAGAMLTGLGMGLTAIVSTPFGYACTIAVWTLGEIAIAPTGAAVVADLAPVHLRGCYQGAYHFAWGSAGFAAPIVSSFVMARFDATVLWCGCLCVGVFAAIAHLYCPASRIRRVQYAVGQGEPNPPTAAYSAADV